MLFSFTFYFTGDWMSDPFVQVQVFHDTWLKREGRVASGREPKDGELLHWWEFLGVDGHWNVCSGLRPRLGTGARCPILPLHGGHLCVYHAEEERPTLGVQAVGKTSTGEMTHCAAYYSRLYLCVFNNVRVELESRYRRTSAFHGLDNNTKTKGPFDKNEIALWWAIVLLYFT